MYNVMIFSRVFVVFMHTNHKITPNSPQKMWSKNKPNCTPVYRGWSYPVGLQAKPNILNLWTWSSLNLYRKFGLSQSQKMDDITYCRNMRNLDWFFYDGLWKEVVVSFRMLMKLMLMHSCCFIVNNALCSFKTFYASLNFFWNNYPIKGPGVWNIQIIYIREVIK